MGGGGGIVGISERADLLVTMSQWSSEHRAFAIEAFFKSNDSYVIARRQLCSHFGIRRVSDGPSVNLIRSWVQRFRATASAMNASRPGPSRSSRTPDNIELVEESLRDNPRLSIRKRAAQLGLPRAIIHEILKKDLKFHPFKIQIVQQLQENDFVSRKNFCEMMLERFRTVNSIFWSDEAHFHLNGHVNKQNCRYWSPRSHNPRLKHQKPLHCPRVTVWCALSTNGIIGPFFFENARGQATNVNSENYRGMITNFFLPNLRAHPSFSSHTWFQQDGATAHTARASMTLLREAFPQKLISRFGDIPWPPRSPDLTPMDFFLWGYLKERVYINNPQTLVNLRENIRREISTIEPSLLQRVARNTRLRFEQCVQLDGRHLDDIILKMKSALLLCPSIL